MDTVRAIRGDLPGRLGCQVNADECALLLSLHPRFAESILKGTKSVEIRRKRPSAAPGMPIILYATVPTGAFIGTARISKTYTATPRDVWSQHHRNIGLSRDEFDSYLSGSPRASALVLSDVRRLDRPVTLAEIRAAVPFQPPQGYRYLTPNELQRMLAGVVDASTILERSWPTSGAS